MVAPASKSKIANQICKGGIVKNMIYGPFLVTYESVLVGFFEVLEEFAGRLMNTTFYC